MSTTFDPMQFFGILRLPLYAILVLLFTLVATTKWHVSRWWFAVLLTQALIYLYQLYGFSEAISRNLPLVLPPAYTALLFVQTGFLLAFNVQSFFSNRKKGINHGKCEVGGDGQVHPG